MLQVYSLASGSSGNCIYIKYGETAFLVDAGISYARIRAAIAAIGEDVCTLQGVLITHDHSDHTGGLDTLLKKHSIPIYTTLATATTLYSESARPENIAAAVRTVESGEAYDLGEVYFIPFSTPHDAVGSVGFRIVCPNGDIVGIATDIGCITHEVVGGLSGCQTVIVESNHDPELLRVGPYPPQLKQRVASDKGHLSNADCGRLVSALAAAGATDVTLFHLSKENNHEELALSTVRSVLAECGACLDKICLRVAKEKETVQIV